MKHSALLFCTVVATLCLGCTMTSHRANRGSVSSTWINTKTPGILKTTDACGIYLIFSEKTSVGIDVECIVDYLQDEPAFEPQANHQPPLDPWIRWIHRF